MIDLLISMMVVVIVLGLAVTLISKFREAANKERSLNNLRQIGIAIKNFESNFDKFPTLCDYGPGAPTGTGLCSLFFQVLPYIDGRSIYQLFQQQNPSTYYNQDNGEAKSIYKSLISPADPSAPDGITSTSTITGVSPSFTGTYATTSYAVNGMVFQPGANWKSLSDGLPVTIMVAERYQVCKLGKANEPPTANDANVYTMWGLGAYSNSTPAFALATPDGMDVPVATPPNQMFVPNASQNNLITPKGCWASAPQSEVVFSNTLISGAPGGFQVAPRGSVICDARVPQTPHTAGMLVVMADGSTRTIDGKINALTFWSVVTPQGNETLGLQW